MKLCLMIALVLSTGLADAQKPARKFFDVHLHGANDAPAQVAALKNARVYKAAMSSSWELQNSYRTIQGIDFLYGLMLPCPNGKVPYSLQPCYTDGSDWPPVDWVEQQVKNKKIDFFGEILSQYYGISSADSLLLPYYRIAVKYELPVGIHTGGAGPDHGSPNFSLEMGNPLLIEKLLVQFPTLKIWIMHAGDQYYPETIRIMRANNKVFADISVLSNPFIVPAERFAAIMKDLIEAGLEDQLMLGTDNGPVEKVIQAVESLTFLNEDQKDKIFYKNAEAFFSRNSVTETRLSSQ
jgi:hypothetical protein